MFNPDTFLHTPITSASETTYEPVPVGEYQAHCRDIKVRMAGDSPIIEVFWEIFAPGNDLAHEQTVRQTVWLDIDEAGNLASGRNKNVALGILREVAGQNVEGLDWVPTQLVGTSATVRVDHRERDGKFYAQVSNITAARG